MTTIATPVENGAAILSVPWRPRGDRIVVLPLMHATSSQAGLILSDANRERPESGVVVAIGPGLTSPETARFVPVESRVGELVSYGRYAGQDFDAPGGPDGPVRVIVMRDCEVLLAKAPGEYVLVQHEGDPRRVHEDGLCCAHCETPKSVIIEQERRRLIAERESSSCCQPARLP